MNRDREFLQQGCKSLVLKKNSSLKNQAYLLGCVALLSVSVAAFSPAAAQVGPPAPEEHPRPKTQTTEAMEAMKSSFMKIFKKAGSEEAQTEAQTGEMPSEEEKIRQSQSVVKPPPEVTAPAREPLIVQPKLRDPKIEAPEISEENPPLKLPALDNPENPLGFAVAEHRLKDVETLIQQKSFGQAQQKLTPLRQWLIDATEAHINLYKALNNIPSARAQAELEKQLALEFAILRDKSLFLMGKINVGENNYQKAIKDFTEVVKSQPRSEIGLESYEILQKIGFTQKLQLAE